MVRRRLHSTGERRAWGWSPAVRFENPNDEAVRSGKLRDHPVMFVNLSPNAADRLHHSSNRRYRAMKRQTREVSMSAQPLSLVDALELAGWSPRQLTAAINGQLSRQGRDRDRIDATAAYPWVRRGYRPRPPIPGVAASVLSEQLGFPVTVEQLWPGRPATGRSEEHTSELQSQSNL